MDVRMSGLKIRLMRLTKRTVVHDNMQDVSSVVWQSFVVWLLVENE